jgi:hypothetical protein
MLLHKKFLFYPDIKAELSENYQSIIKFLGYWVAGDEKLFKFQGVSGWQRMKHDSIGLWTYELCGRLPGGLGFLIHTYSHSVSAAMGDSIPTAEVMKKWGSIISDLKAIAHNTLLVSDSYYLDQTGQYWLEELEIFYLCAVQDCRFPGLAEMAKQHCKQPGKTAIFHNEPSNESFILHWYPDGHLRKKYIFTNCLTRENRNTQKAWVPGCDDYSLMFNVCDHFNHTLHEKTFPHHPSSDLTALHDFHFSCLLLNVSSPSTPSIPQQPTTVPKCSS